MSREKIPLVDLRSQYKKISKDIDETIKAIVTNASFINGEDNKLFEKEFAAYCNVKYCVGVASGSVALDFALEALGVQPKDEVLCPSHTFTATAEAIVHHGATPVFVDIDEANYNINPDLIEKKISRETRGIIIVHLYGQPADMARIRQIARAYDLFVVEDAAQAHGALYREKKVGSLGDIACFSFSPAKNLGCYGDGGAIVTDKKQLADKVRLLRDHGRFAKYNHLLVGYGARLDNLQAAILRVKLRYLDRWNKRRREIARIYDAELRQKYIIPQVSKIVRPVYYVYTLRHPERERIVKKLARNNVSTGVYYPIPLHLQRAYQYLNYRKGDLPLTEEVCREIFSIPIYPELRKKQIDRIIELLLSRQATS